MTENQTTEERLTELAAPDDDAAKLFRERVWHWMCPCTKGLTCRWPTCAGVGDGLGHHP